MAGGTDLVAGGTRAGEGRLNCGRGRTIGTWALRAGAVLQTLVIVLSCVVLGGLVFAFSKFRAHREQEVSVGARRQRRAALQREVDALVPRYHLARTATDVDGHCALGVDARADAILVATSGAEGLKLVAVEPRDLVDAEVVEHVCSVASKASAQVEATVKAVELRLFVGTVGDPVRVLGLLPGDAVFGSPAHRAARDEALLWQGIVRAMIHGLDRTPDPVRQLAALEEAARAGTLDPEELKREKAKLVAGRYLQHKARVADELAQRQTRQASEPPATAAR